MLARTNLKEWDTITNSQKKLDLIPSLEQKRIRTLMLGPSLKEQGGMGAVANLILNSTLGKIELKHISTWNSQPSQFKQIYLLALFLVAACQLLGRLLLQQVDLVHLHLSERGSAWRTCILVLMTLLFRKPIIIHTHGAEFHTFHAQLSPKLRQALNWVLQQSTYLIVLSKSWQKFYINSCGLKEEQVKVLPNPVELPTQVPVRANNQIIELVFLGKITQRKGVYDLLHAFASLDKELCQTMKLTIAGSGELEPTIALARKLGIENQVYFPGWITKEERNKLLTKADIFVLSAYNEGLPMALLEAMSYGLPVISTPVGGIPEVVIEGKTGLLVEPGNIQQLTAAIESLSKDTNKRNSLGKEARKKVSSLSIENYRDSLSKLYFSAVKICKN